MTACFTDSGVSSDATRNGELFHSQLRDCNEHSQLRDMNPPLATASNPNTRHCELTQTLAIVSNCTRHYEQHC